MAAEILSPEALEGGYCRRVPDAIFAHPRLAPICDVFDGDRDDWLPISALPMSWARTVYSMSVAAPACTA